MIYKNTKKIFLQGKKLLLLIPAVLFLMNSAFSQTTCRSDFDYRINQNSKTVVFEAKSNRTPAVFGFKFGDGTSSRGQRVSHTYSTAGSYNVILTTVAFDSVTNHRCTTSVTKKITIVDCDRLKASFRYVVDGMTVKLVGETNSQHAITIFKFGDGHSARKKEIKHTYSKPGIYDVCFIAEDTIHGCRKVVCKKVVISAPCKLEAKFDYRQEGNNLKFVAKASEAPARFLWNFGDGDKGSGDEIGHSYDKPGVYEVCLTVYALNATNNQICTTKVCRRIEIKKDNDCGLRAKFDYRQDRNHFKFKAVANDSHARYVWNFGDGSDASGAEVKHEYKKPGTYLVCVTVYTGKLGSKYHPLCSTKVCKRIIIEKPSCKLEGNYRFNVDRLYVKFEGKANEDKVHYFWSFGDGSDATGKLARHKYDKPGVYEVCLIIFNPRTKCKVCICKKVVIEKPCNLKAKIYERIDHNIVRVRARSNASNTSTFHWDFGDGSTATGRRARHKYAKKGIYIITLTVSDKRRDCRIQVKKKIVIGIRKQQFTTVDAQKEEDRIDAKKEIMENKLENLWDAKVTPSPARSSVKISSEEKELSKVQIYDMNGSIVINLNENLSNIDISLLQKGFYYAHVTATDGTTTIVKFLKE